MREVISFTRDVAVLSSIQSVGATVGVPVVAYFMSGGEPSTDLVALAAGLIFLHFSLFAHNDIEDMEADREAGRTDKPLASWKLSMTVAMVYSSVMLVVGSVIIWYFLSLETFLLTSVGVMLGLVYNRFSSTTPWGSPLLGAWGVVIVSAGASAGGGYGTPTGIFAMLTGVSLSLVTFYADAADCATDQHSFALSMGYKQEEGVILGTTKSMAVVSAGVLLQLFLFIPLWQMEGLYSILSAAMLGVSIATVLVMESFMMREEKFRKLLVVYTLATVAALMMVAAPYAGELVVTVISGLVVGWAILSMRLFYGSVVEYA